MKIRIDTEEKQLVFSDLEVGQVFQSIATKSIYLKLRNERRDNTFVLKQGVKGSYKANSEMQTPPKEPVILFDAEMTLVEKDGK